MNGTPVCYELPPFRPPSEAYSLLIRATRNCPWNRCAFCSMYKTEKFQLRPVAEVKEDILSLKALADHVKQWARRIGCGDRVGQVARANGILWLDDGGVKRAFIGDSNSIIMRSEDLAQVVEFLYQTCPTVGRVTSYGRAHTILHKRPEELARLKEAGLTRLHLGLETGDDELLAYMEKGVSAQQGGHASPDRRRAGDAT